MVSRKNHASKHREKSNGERYRNAVLNHVLYILISGPMDPSKRRGTSDFHEINFAKQVCFVRDPKVCSALIFIFP